MSHISFTPKIKKDVHWLMINPRYFFKWPYNSYSRNRLYFFKFYIKIDYSVYLKVEGVGISNPEG